MNFYKNLYNFLIYEKRPSEYLTFLKNKGLISHIPELHLLIGTPQDPQWHPEGDVWIHTLLVLDRASELRENFYYEEDCLAFMLGALCHDLGKPYTTQWDKGRWISHRHDVIGCLPGATLVDRMGCNSSIRSKVIAYIIEHLHPMQLYKVRENISDKTIIKLSERINIKHLCLLAKADHFGRNTEDAIRREAPHCDWLLNRYLELV
ncbi:MAG TPA: HD domain-containing protein [Candidatus Kapabacteria bacterium]|nr:HD domain-containing protein [Candidatus Kapabacteria bacterium]